jgi:hypothetical protein
MNDNNCTVFNLTLSERLSNAMHKSQAFYSLINYKEPIPFNNTFEVVIHKQLIEEVIDKLKEIEGKEVKE